MAILVEMDYSNASDIFSIGCIIAELVKGAPLFPVCGQSQWYRYRREKTVLFNAIIGPFSDDMIYSIHKRFKGIFRSSNSDFPEIDIWVSAPIRKFVEDVSHLSVGVEHFFAICYQSLMLTCRFLSRTLRREIS